MHKIKKNEEEILGRKKGVAQHENLSSDPQNPCKSQQWPSPEAPKLGRSLELAGQPYGQVSSVRDSESRRKGECI